ncbi:MAG: hypothetical protein JW915_18750 [Chitinispirillaceae bacterium]|nr:hypothetical protein [Chitinispirillaceae bacterium]
MNNQQFTIYKKYFYPQIVKVLTDAENRFSLVILMADITGVPEGSGIIFDIYKTSEDPSMCFATANGKNVPFFPGCA